MTYQQCIALMTTALLGDEDTELTRQTALEQAISLYEFVKIELIRMEKAKIVKEYGEY